MFTTSSFHSQEVLCNALGKKHRHYVTANIKTEHTMSPLQWSISEASSVIMVFQQEFRFRIGSSQTRPRTLSSAENKTSSTHMHSCPRIFTGTGVSNGRHSLQKEVPWHAVSKNCIKNKSTTLLKHIGLLSEAVSVFRSSSGYSSSLFRLAMLHNSLINFYTAFTTASAN